VFNNNWMLDQYFTAILKLVNSFFGQFALPFGHGDYTHVFQPTRLATTPPGTLAGPRDAPL
jgi:hypothetical protein